LYIGYINYTDLIRLLKVAFFFNNFISQLLKSVRFHTSDGCAAIYETYHADIDLSLEGLRREVARLRTRWPLQNGKICQQHFVPYLIL
jgi:hypothetical protein